MGTRLESLQGRPFRFPLKKKSVSFNSKIYSFTSGQGAQREIVLNHPEENIGLYSNGVSSMTGTKKKDQKFPWLPSQGKDSRSAQEGRKHSKRS